MVGLGFASLHNYLLECFKETYCSDMVLFKWKEVRGFGFGFGFGIGIGMGVILIVICCFVFNWCQGFFKTYVGISFGRAPD